MLPLSRREQLKLRLIGMACACLFMASPKLICIYLVWSDRQLAALRGIAGF